MSTTTPRLLARMPGLYRSRDATVEGQPLAALARVLQAELDRLDDASRQLLDDHFAERASGEALVLLAELVGARLLGEDSRANRAVVSRSIHWRRRKGALATLEEVLALTSGWSAEVDEAFRSLLITQELDNLVPWRGRTAVLWDPIALADPLSRRAPGREPPREAAPQRSPLLAPQADETVEDVLRRLGRADAGRHAASPRTIDLAGWARPDVAVVRTARVEPVLVQDSPLAVRRDLPHTGDPELAFVGACVDPLGRDLPLMWRQPLERPDLTGGLTDDHEPDPEPPAAERTADVLLTPTALAADGDLAERAGAFCLKVDGVLVVGPPSTGQAEQVLPWAAPGERAILRFADRRRPSPGETWQLALEPHEDSKVALRLQRTSAGAGGMSRAADGTWATFPLGGRRGEPLTAVVRVRDGAEDLLVRVERSAEGALQVATWPTDGSAVAWSAQPLLAAPGTTLPPVDPDALGPELGLAAAGAVAYLVAPLDQAGSLGAWRLDLLGGGPPTATRLDDAPASPRLPEARPLPTVVVHDGRLFVYGGRGSQAPLGDLWSLPEGGGPWRPHQVRPPTGADPDPTRREGATLLSTPGGLVLLGGASEPGSLDPTAWRCDPGQARPRWRALPPLPLPTGRPGVLVARADGTALQVVAWADRTRPRALRLAAGAEAWSLGPLELGAPNPPADGEAVFVGARLRLVGPSPLPPSEVLFTLDGTSHLAYLPALDPRGDQAQLFLVSADGATRRLSPADHEAPATVRLAGGREARSDRREPGAEGPRLGVPGRLAHRPFRLRQLTLGRVGPPVDGAAAWPAALDLALDEVVGLDPRLGRVAIRAEVADGQLSATWRQGRPALLGAGAAPADLAPRPAWQPPDLPAPPTPPEADEDRPAGPLPVTAWVSPERAGAQLPTSAGSATTHASLSAALQASPEAAEVYLGVLGSARLPSDRLGLAPGRALRIAAVDTGGLPMVEATRGASLTLHGQLPAASADDGPDDPPAPALLASGLALAGALEVALITASLDLRWCTLGTPGQLGLRVAGAGHQAPLARRTLPAATVQLLLVGCQLGRIELPPWVELLALGCTFDGGARDLPAIDAAGARVRLRHCTVHGTTTAGQLRGSSCAFAGAVVAEVPDESWLRTSLLPEGGRPPPTWRCLRHHLSLASLDPTSPQYLLLDVNNGPAALAAAEGGRVPGAHEERGRQLRELEVRTEDFLPLGLVPAHIDRTTADLARSHRRLP